MDPKNEGFQILVDLPCEKLDAEYYEQVFDHIHNNDPSKKASYTEHEVCINLF